MSASKNSLRKLITSARKAHTPAPPPPSEIPFGFCSRVAARWADAPRRSFADFWERLCWWGAGVSVAVCLVAFAAHSLQPEPNPFDVLLESEAPDPKAL